MVILAPIAFPKVNMTSLREGKWITWNGGSSPVTKGVMVEVKLRYGRDPVRADGDSLRWSHDLYNAYGAEDIVAYRIVAVLGSGALADALPG